MKAKKNGVIARIGLYAAIASMFGAKASRAEYDRRNNCKKFSTKTSGASGSHRAGFKLVKKLHRKRSWH